MKLPLPKIGFRHRRFASTPPPSVFERKPVREPGQGWIPECVCGRDCLPPRAEGASRWVQAARWAAFVLVMLTSPVLLCVRVLPERLRPVPVQWYAWLAVSALGVRVKVRRAEDLPSISAPNGAGEVWAPQHTSWLDAILLHAITRSTYVARGDLMGVPVVRALAGALRMIPIDRTKLHELPGLVAEAGRRVAAGERVVVFPEATTWCGKHRGRFHPAFFEAAASTGGRVRPVSIWYGDDAGEPDVSPCFVLEDNGLDSIRRIVRHRGVWANIWIGPGLAGTDRRELAELAERLVFGRTPEYAEQDVQAA
ncbi:MAG: lysophospholipid acyltransferase family protein [Segniliparus sp.]|uniref:lysophospholipid acyltransferase family protein n=1 Tax=Segniliparus sp. TaxID=2804064 RepID=UPI003F3F2F61